LRSPEYPDDKYNSSNRTSFAHPNHNTAKGADENLLPIKVDDLDNKMAPVNPLKADLQQVSAEIDDLWHHLTFDNKKKDSSSGKEPIRKQ